MKATDSQTGETVAGESVAEVEMQLLKLWGEL